MIIGDYKEAKGLRQITGLMFRTRRTKPLLFDFKKLCNISIHSFFVFFTFRAYFLDENFNYIEILEVHPFQIIKPKFLYRYLIEIPI
jgi:uncharacterized membrane protein (UPF0127 family)